MGSLVYAEFEVGFTTARSAHSTSIFLGWLSVPVVSAPCLGILAEDPELAPKCS